MDPTDRSTFTNLGVYLLHERQKFVDKNLKVTEKKKKSSPVCLQPIGELSIHFPQRENINII